MDIMRIIADLVLGFIFSVGLYIIANNLAETTGGKVRMLIFYPLCIFFLISIPHLGNMTRWKIMSILGDKAYLIFLSYGMLFMFWTSKPLILGNKKFTDTLFNYDGIFFYMLGFICIVIGLFLDNDVFIR